MTLIIGGLALAGLLVYGWTTGQELPIVPAIAVVMVNLVAAVKLALDSRKGRRLPLSTQEAATQPTPQSSRSKSRRGK